MFSKRKTNYMAEVESWLEKEVFPPIAESDSANRRSAYRNASKLIKEKLLESYKNGIAAKQTKRQSNA